MDGELKNKITCLDCRNHNKGGCGVEGKEK